MPQHLRAVFWMFGTLIALSLMGLAARELSDIYNTVQIVFVRNVVGLAVILILMLRLGTGMVRTQRISMHGLRNLCHIAAVGCCSMVFPYCPWRKFSFSNPPCRSGW